MTYWKQWDKVDLDFWQNADFSEDEEKKDLDLEDFMDEKVNYDTCPYCTGRGCQYCLGLNR